MANALFTINGDSSNQGFDATASQVLTLRLKTLPVSGVSSVRFQVWDASAFDPSLDPLRNPPRKAKLSPNLTLVGSTSGPSVAPAAIDGTVQVTMPGSIGHAWIIRCVVNGGMRTVGGRAVFEPSFVHERMVVIRDTDGNRPIIATETTQYEDDGWAPSVGKGEPGDDAPLATAGEPGYLARYVFVNAASTRLNTTFAGVTCQAAPTWTTAADIPPGNLFDVQVAAPGGGGAGANSSEGQGGAGGGGGARRRRWFSRADIIAMLPLVLVCGLGGAAGLGGHTDNSVQIVTATAGGNGTSTSFGWFVAGGGSGGSIGTTGRHAGTGGGIADAPTPANATAAQLGGVPAQTAGAPGLFLEGAGHGSTSTGNSFPGLPAVYGGASGGASNAGAESIGAGGRAVFGGGGGGSGRSTDLTVGVGNVGADGGGRWTDATTTGGGGAGGPGHAANGAVPDPASDGADGDIRANGAGGGGGGSHDGNTTTAIGGEGGDGGFPGGGGGGGGSTRIRTFAGRVCIGGTGGKGGDGCIIIDSFR